MTNESMIFGMFASGVPNISNISESWFRVTPKMLLPKLSAIYTPTFVTDHAGRICFVFIFTLMYSFVALNAPLE